MKLVTEAAWVAGSAAVAGLGVALVDFGETGQVSWAAGLVVLALGGCLGALVAAVRRWAPATSSFLLWPTALLVALGLVEIYRIDPMGAPIQVWWLVAGVVAAIWILAAFRLGVERLMSVGYWLASAGLCLIVLPFLPRLMDGESGDAAGLWLTIGWGNVSFIAQPFGLGAVLLAVGLAGVQSRWALDPPPERVGNRLVSMRNHLMVAAVWVITLPLLWATGDLTAWAMLVILSVTIAYAATGEGRVVWTGLGLVGMGLRCRADFLPGQGDRSGLAGPILGRGGGRRFERESAGAGQRPFVGFRFGDGRSRVDPTRHQRLDLGCPGGRTGISGNGGCDNALRAGYRGGGGNRHRFP